MPSYYDDDKKCRVGVMDEAQFRAESDPRCAAFFADLIAAWTQAGGLLRWGAGGVSLRGAIAGTEVAVCFLAPQFAGKKDRIELACTTLGKQIGVPRLAALEAALRAAAAERVLGKSMLSIVEPGLLPAAGQAALVRAFVDLV
jgi:hypothetical protein